MAKAETNSDGSVIAPIKTRPATSDEIIANYSRAIQKGETVRYRGFLREVSAPRARNGVRHIEYFRGKIVVVNGEPIVVARGQAEKLTDTVYLGDGAKSDKPILFDLRIKSEYLK